MSIRTKPKKSVSILLEQGSLKSLKEANDLMNDQVRFNWSLYSELARQRNGIHDELVAVINRSSKSGFKISNWQRAIKYQYSLHPLCTLGSINWVGGSFNTGNDIANSIPTLQALYLAMDKDTALQEHLSQVEDKMDLSAREIALTSPNSETIVSISGFLDRYFDLTDENNLIEFARFLSKIKLPKRIIDEAKKLNNPIPTILKTPSQLLKAFLDPNWRLSPTGYDCPSNSQIFGQLVASAGIQGILYPSKFTGKNCLAIFPKNFEGNSSILKLDDTPPLDNVPKEINGHNWKLCELPYEIFNSEEITANH